MGDKKAGNHLTGRMELEKAECKGEGSAILAIPKDKSENQSGSG